MLDNLVYLLSYAFNRRIHFCISYNLFFILCLSKLHSCYFSRPSYTSLQIGDCTSLNILSLRENLLRRLPSEIGNCNRLRVLDVSGNRYFFAMLCSR